MDLPAGEQQAALYMTEPCVGARRLGTARAIAMDPPSCRPASRQGQRLSKTPFLPAPVSAHSPSVFLASAPTIGRPSWATGLRQAVCSTMSPPRIVGYETGRAVQDVIASRLRRFLVVTRVPLRSAQPDQPVRLTPDVITAVPDPVSELRAGQIQPEDFALNGH